MPYPIIILAPDDYNIGPLTAFLRRDVKSQGATLKGTPREGLLELRIESGRRDNIRIREDVQ